MKLGMFVEGYEAKESEDEESTKGKKARDEKGIK